ncbi:MFS transporter [Bacillaceae bacterium W0354]
MHNYSEDKRVSIIALITAACVIGDAMLFIVLPIYWEKFGLTALWQVGVLLSVNRLIRLPINPLVGWFYHRMGKRTGVIIAVLLASFSTMSYGMFQSFIILLFMRMIWGVAWSFLRLGGFLTVIEVASDRNRGRLIGKYNGLWGLGGLVGMLIGGLLADSIGITFVTTAFAIISISSLPFVIKYIPKTKEANSRDKSRSNNKPSQSYWKNKQVWAILLTGVVMAMVVFGIFLSTLSRLVELHMTTELVVFGFIIGAASISGVMQAIKWGWDPVLAPLVGKWSDEKFGRIPMLVFVFISASVVFFLFTIQINLVILLMLLLIFQLLSTILVTVTDSLASDVASKTSKVGVMTAYTVAVDVGSALGPLFSYIVVDFLSFTALYQMTAILLVFVGCLWFINVKRNPEFI